MTLTNRLLLFFLSMLAIVLVGFSTALYFVAERYLHQQVAERLDSVLNTLCGIIEVDSEGVEWKPETRNVSLDFPVLGDQVVWLLADQNGRVIDRSKNGADIESCFPAGSPSLKFELSEGGDLLKKGADPLRTSALQGPNDAPQRGGPLFQETARTVKWQGVGWEFGRRWIHSESSSTESGGTGPIETQDNEVKYQAISVTAGVQLQSVTVTLHQLLVSLVFLSVIVWLASFGAGRFVCRRALRPMTRLAESARAIDANDIAHQRLPVVESKDELEEMSRSFNSLLDRLQDAFERQKRFTGDASHQLRTPLTVILGHIEVALRRDRSPDEYRQTLVTVQQKSEHLAQMVESLLFLARADAESSIPAVQTVDLTNWLPQHLQSWAYHERFKDISFECSFSSPCLVQVHASLLGELLNVLLDNACKYSESGTGIKLQLEQDSTNVRIHVTDQGCGIDQAELGSVFEPFFRSQDSYRRGLAGVGLGLSIAKRLANMFHGELQVSSQPGQGSCFTLTFKSIGP